jgi:hypothetical protein
MRTIRVIPTITESFSCVFRHPKAIVPFFVLFVIVGVIIAFVVNRMFIFFDFVEEPETFYFFDQFFTFLTTIFLTALFAFFAFPYVEGWTFAALDSAYRNEPVSLRKTARKALSKYIGMVVITIVVAVIMLIVQFIISIVFTLIMFFTMARNFPFTAEPYPEASIFPMAGELFVMYAVMFLIIVIVTVVFIYFKPAYIIGGNSLTDSFKDGFDTVKNNFAPSCLFYLFFVVLQFLVAGVTTVILVFGGIIDFEKLQYVENIDVVYSEFMHVIPLAVVVVVVYFVLYVISYAAVAYAYMDAHELV